MGNNTSVLPCLPGRCCFACVCFLLQPRPTLPWGDGLTLDLQHGGWGGLACPAGTVLAACTLR